VDDAEVSLFQGDGGSGLFRGEGGPRPDDLDLAWDAADRYAVTLLWQALPEVRSAARPADELHAAAEAIRSNIRRPPYRHLARRVWGRGRPPADDTDLWLDAAGAMATMGHHLDTDSRPLAALAVLRPADWAGAVIGLVRAGVAVPATGADLVRYARGCQEIETAAKHEPGHDDQAYDPFASGSDDDRTLARGFEAALMCWAAVDAVNEQCWLTGLGWWGLPRALARAWNTDFDAAGPAIANDSGEDHVPHATWPGREAKPEELGIRRPPLIC
jgi:hypothetical protein